MPFYRTDSGDGIVGTVHINFGRKREPLPCRAPALESDDRSAGHFCGRMSVALCDHPAGLDLAGKPLTCDFPMCERHRTRVGADLDHCPRHAKQQKLPAVAS